MKADVRPQRSAGRLSYSRIDRIRYSLRREAEMPSDEEIARERTAADMVAALEDEMRAISVGDYLTYLMQSISVMGLRRLGLSAETAGDRDLEQSRLAIEAFRALLGVVEGTRAPEEVALHRAMLSQMQLAYVAALDFRSEPELEDDEEPESGED